jgi:hypothetical protein
MGHIRNVVLIIAITAIMAVLTSAFAYFFDHLTINSFGSSTNFLLDIGIRQKYNNNPLFYLL